MRPPPPLPPHPPSDLSLPQYRISPAPLPPYHAMLDRTSPVGFAAVSPPPAHNMQNPVGWTPSLPSDMPSPDYIDYRGHIPSFSQPASAILPLIASPTCPPPPLPSFSAPPGAYNPPPPPPFSPNSTPRTSESLSHPHPAIHSQPISPQGTGAIYVQPSHSVQQQALSQTVPGYPPAPPRAPLPPPSVPASDILGAEDENISAPALPYAPVHAPPRPPNPELLRLHGQVHAKLSSDLASLQQAMALDAERLRANQADLLNGEPAIRDEMARLEAVRDVCLGVAGRMSAVVGEAERNVAELKRRGDPSVDELVCSTTIVHDQ